MPIMHPKRIQEKVKQDYNLIAKGFSDSRQFPWKDFDLFLPYYKESFDVLDFGCGNGRLLQFLEKYGFKKYVGIDQSEELIKLAKKEHSKAEFLVADISDSLELKKIDAIFAIASFHHIPPCDQLETLKKWKKYLKPGGYIFMTNWNLHQIEFWPLWLRSLIWPSYGFRGLLVPWQNRVRRYYFAFTKRRLARLLKAAGFELIFNDYIRNGEAATLLHGKNIVTIARLPKILI